MKKYAQCGPLPPGLIPLLCNQLSEQGFSIETTIFAGFAHAPARKNIVSLEGQGPQAETIPLSFVLFSKDVEPNEELPRPEIDLPGVSIGSR
jgi:hypothetical protein